MRRLTPATLTATALILVFTFPIAAEPEPPTVANTPKLSPADEQAKIHLPPGFELQLVAAEPDIHKPLNMAFDDRGRLWLTDTVEYPYPAPAGRPGRDRVMILDDFAPDGKARKITTFADGLNIPIGILPYKDGCIVHSIPNIWRLTDTDGDGKADKREVLYSSIGSRDTHGMTSSFTIGYDGWLYACHGYLNDSVLKGSDGQELRMNSGNTYRMRLDGSHCEINTRGQVNPFGLAWDRFGNLYSADCHSMPLTQLLRGAYYQSFGKPSDGLGFAPHMNTFDNHSTALCGLVIYDANQFPPEYRDRMFMCDVVFNRVNAYDVALTGSSPSAKFRKFLTSDDPWFRPVDVKLGPDGALYIADFYNRIIGHYEVPLGHPGRDRDSGRIWRVVWKNLKDNNPPPKRPYDDLPKESVEKLVELLGYDNITVRMQAMNQLVERGRSVKDAVTPALSDPSELRRVHAMWVVERLGGLDAAAVQKASDDRSTLVATHLAHILAERRTIAAKPREWLIAGLKNESPAVQRAAADALGRHAAAQNILPLLQLFNRTPTGDNHLQHVVRMALRNHVADGSALRVNAKLLSPADMTALAGAALGTNTLEAVGFMLDDVLPAKVDPATLSNAVYFIARYGKERAVRIVLEMGQANPDFRRQVDVFRAFYRGTQERGTGLPPAAREWAGTLTATLLDSSDSGLRQVGAELVGSIRLTSKEPELLALAADASAGDGPRAAALAALAALDARKHAATIGAVVRDGNAPGSLRDRAARVLGTLNLREARGELAASFPNASGPLAAAIAAALVNTPAGCEELLNAIATGKASPRLLQDRVIQTRMRDARVRQLDERLRTLTAGLPAFDQKIDAILKQRAESFTRAKPDAANGLKLYEKHCAACHQLAGKGTKVGPQLDGIGARGTEKLIEDILDPNRNVDPNFRTTRLTLKNGMELTGLLLREEGEVVVLADNMGKEVRVEKRQIEEKTISPLSPMPANWSEQIPERDFADLLGYLLRQRGK